LFYARLYAKVFAETWEQENFMQIRHIYETAKDTDERIREIPARNRGLDEAKLPSFILGVDPDKKFQTIQGFGGALTESSGYVLGKLAAAERERALASYFDPKNGNGYTFARTHLNSCDFSLRNWACVQEKDETLASFSMDDTDRYQTPLIKDAIRLSGGKLSLLVSPWSPPAWMKDNNDMNHGGKLLEKYYPLWAKYFTRFIGDLKARGIPVWCVSVQNEPAANQTWDSCLWTGTEEGIFATKHLGPELEAAGFGDVKILVWDHNRDLLWDRMQESMAVPGADKYIDGAAFHWYSGDQYDNVAKVAATWPGKLLVFTEGCVEGGPRPGAWFTGERYAHNIINDLNAGCTAWIDWNIALDTQGGPNHVGNFCDAPLLVDTEKGTVEYQSSFWYIGHFSRFIKPGAVRVGLTMDSWMVPAAVDGRIGNTMEATAFRNPDGTLAVVLCNRTEADMIYMLNGCLGGEYKAMRCPPRGIQTLIFE
jgi:glucosylceramidase